MNLPNLPNLLGFLPRRRPLVLPSAPSAPSARSTPPTRGTPAPDEEPPVHGCGWFDSSHDLHEGLCVEEHSSTDSLVPELPLSSWLELQLAGWRVPQAA